MLCRRQPQLQHEQCDGDGIHAILQGIETVLGELRAEGPAGIDRGMIHGGRFCQPGQAVRIRAGPGRPQP
jgi:hypothetical protein